MSKLVFSSSRGTADLELQILTREGSAYGVGILLSGKLVEIVQPEGFKSLALWLLENARNVARAARAIGDEEGA